MTRCGCKRGEVAAAAANVVITTYTGNNDAGNIAGEIAGTAACESTGFLLNIYTTISIAVTSVFFYTRNSIYNYFHKTAPKSTLQICDKSLGLSVEDSNYHLSISYDKDSNLTYIQAEAQGKFVALPGKSDFKVSDIELIKCVPFTISADLSKLNIIDNPLTTKIKGTDGDDYIISPQTPTGKEIAIFAIGGLNLMLAGPDFTIFLFSLCSTDIINKSVGVIRGLDSESLHHHIAFTCTKTPIHIDMINIFYDRFQDQDFTFIQSCGREKCSAIAIEGHHPLAIDDIILNIPWSKLSEADFSLADFNNS